MGASLQGKLVVAISSRALFDLEEENRVFEQSDDKAYMATRTDAQLLEVIHKGKGAMPKWEGQLSEAEIAAVLQHVRELGKTK